MLDLKELERRLDASLAHETKESLNSWLDKERENSIDFIFEECDFLPLANHTMSFAVNVPTYKYHFDVNDGFAGESNYDIAA